MPEQTGQKKCAHPSCECTVAKNGPYGKYCSEHCKETRGFTELRCQCRHAECEGEKRLSAAPART